MHTIEDLAVFWSMTASAIWWIFLTFFSTFSASILLKMSTPKKCLQVPWNAIFEKKSSNFKSSNFFLLKVNGWASKTHNMKNFLKNLQFKEEMDEKRFDKNWQHFLPSFKLHFLGYLEAFFEGNPWNKRSLESKIKISSEKKSLNAKPLNLVCYLFIHCQIS